MRIRVRESRVYEYEPVFNDPSDSFYEDYGVDTTEKAFEFDRKWIEVDKKGVMEDLDKDPSIVRIWELIGDDDQVVATFQ